MYDFILFYQWVQRFWLQELIELSKTNGLVSIFCSKDLFIFFTLQICHLKMYFTYHLGNATDFT